MTHSQNDLTRFFQSEDGRELDMSAVPRPRGKRLLVRPMSVPSKTAGGILLADYSKDAEAFSRSVGLVVAVGSGVGKGEFADSIVLDEPLKVGDVVLYSKYQSNTIHVHDVRLITLHEDDIIAIVPDPQALVKVK